MSPLLEAALRYAATGWPVLPLHNPRHGGGCSCGKTDCGSKGKHPRTARGLHEASTDPKVIGGWWHRWPFANVGLRTGPESGLLVLDIDGDEGLRSWAKLGAANEPVLTTEVDTPRGAHLYLRYPAGRTIGNSAGRLGEGLDTRGQGGYVLAPPSRHPSGGTYRWCEAAFELLDCPPWLLHLLDPPRPAPRARPPIPTGLRTGAYVRAAVTAELDVLRQATPGSRNVTLNEAAFSLYQLVGSHGASEEQLTEHLEQVALGIGLTPSEVRATLASARRSAQSKPRAVTP